MDSKHGSNTFGISRPLLHLLVNGITVALGMTISQSGQATTINNSNSTVVLQTLDPASSIFDVPVTTTITVFPGEGITGDNSKDWVLTNRGAVKGLLNGIALGSLTAAYAWKTSAVSSAISPTAPVQPYA